MYKILYSLLLLPAFLVAQSPADNKLYTIQVGTFHQPKLADFAALQKVGQVYATGKEADFHNIILGYFEEPVAAHNALVAVKKSGYDAFITEKIKGEKEAIVIQLSSTQNGPALNWAALERAGSLSALLENPRLLKVVVGPFTNTTAAQNRLGQLRKLGYQDAFIKTVDSQLLSPINPFEKGLAAPSFTELLADEIDRIAQAVPTETPTEYSESQVVLMEYDNANIPAELPTTVIPKNIELPATTPTAVININPRVKRTAALDLQKTLKMEGYYRGSLDGYYGAGTAMAYELFKKEDIPYNRYLVLSKHLEQPTTTTKGLQGLINDLTSNDASLIAELERQQAPIAKAYLAYWLLVNQGPSREVNQLMNTAIQQTFTNTQSKGVSAFDYTATYDYSDLRQLLLHLSYLHSTPENTQYTLPCWLFEQHTKEAKTIFVPSKSATQANLQISTCLEFNNWEAIAALRYFVEELQPRQYSQQEIALMNTLEKDRSLLYLFPKKLTHPQKAAIDKWKIVFWNDLKASSNNYPVLEKSLFSLQVLFFQSQVLLEAYYMQKDFTADEAEGLALSVLKTYVEVPLGAYR